MAMNKAEKAYVENLETEISLRWPTVEEPQPMTEARIKELSVEVTPKDTSIFRSRRVAKGWSQNAYSASVEAAWSDGQLNGRGHTGDYASRGIGQIYETERDALIAMRWEMCRRMAKQLHAVDCRIKAIKEA